MTIELPAGVRAVVAGDDDLERLLEFQNRYATPSQWMSVAALRQRRTANPEPLQVTLMAEDTSGRIVAAGKTTDGGLMRSPDASWLLGLRVAEAWRHKGIGHALLEALESHARDHRARRIVAAVRADEREGARFAERTGYHAFHERIDSYIDVASFDALAFEDPDETARRLGIRLATYGELLAEHADDVEAFQRMLYFPMWEMARDVPAATPMPETAPPFEQARAMFAEPLMDHATTIVAMRGDDMVGITVTTVKETGVAHTGFTGVVRSERGKGIALALKLRALRALRQRGVKLFGTTNDAPNAGMRGINAKLGYVPEPPTTMYEKVLA